MLVNDDKTDINRFAVFILHYFYCLIHKRVSFWWRAAHLDRKWLTWKVYQHQIIVCSITHSTCGAGNRITPPSASLAGFEDIHVALLCFTPRVPLNSCNVFSRCREEDWDFMDPSDMPVTLMYCPLPFPCLYDWSVRRLSCVRTGFDPSHDVRMRVKND